VITEFTQPGIVDFHKDHLPLMKKAMGSSNNHQAWPGGYLDHITQCFAIASKLYAALCKLEPLPFSLASAEKVLYFHDIEKIWKYSGEMIGEFAPRPQYPSLPDRIPAGFEKWEWFGNLLHVYYDIQFSLEEINALQYIHGEGNDYSGQSRSMGPLAAFCHSVDVISARIFFNTKGDTWNF
jgi:hypothetical protein